MTDNERTERERVAVAIRTYFASDHMAKVVADAAIAALRPAPVDGLVEVVNKSPAAPTVEQ